MTYHDVTNGPCACGAWHDAQSAMPFLPTEAELIFENDAPSPYSVELDGTGSTENEAIVEALETVAGWGRWSKT